MKNCKFFLLSSFFFGDFVLKQVQKLVTIQSRRLNGVQIAEMVLTQNPGSERLQSYSILQEGMEGNDIESGTAEYT